MELEEYRRASLENWEGMARGWERWRDEIEGTSAPMAGWLLEELDPQPGDTVLELAAGLGETGFGAAILVGERGRLLSTDFSPEMVEVARRRSVELGLRNVEHRVLDAERIDLGDDSVDGVLCRCGYMLMADPVAAFAETRRVLRTGGRLALAVWRGAEENPWISIAGRTLVERGHVPRPEPGAPGIFSLASDDRVRGLLEGAGFTVLRMEDVPVRFVYADVDDYIRRAQETGGIFGKVWREASEQEHEAIRERFADEFEAFEADGRLEFPGLALCASAA